MQLFRPTAHYSGPCIVLWSNEHFLFQLSLAWSSVLHFCVQIDGVTVLHLVPLQSDHDHFSYLMLRSWSSIAILAWCIHNLLIFFYNFAHDTITSWSWFFLWYSHQENFLLNSHWDHGLCTHTIKSRSWSFHQHCQIEIMIFSPTLSQ